MRICHLVAASLFALLFCADFWGKWDDICLLFCLTFYFPISLNFSFFSIPVHFDLHHGTHFGDASKIGDWAKEVLRRLFKIWKSSTVSNYHHF